MATPACTASKTGKHRSLKREAECPACGPKRPRRSDVFSRPVGSVQSPHREPLMGDLLYAMSSLTHEESQNPFIVDARAQDVVERYIERNLDKDDRGLSGFAALDSDGFRTLSITASTCWHFARAHVALHPQTPPGYMAAVIDNPDASFEEFQALGTNPSLPEDLMAELVDRTYDTGDVRANDAVRRIAKRKPLPERIAMMIVKGTLSREARSSAVINESVSPKMLWDFFKSSEDHQYDDWWIDSLVSNPSADADFKRYVVSDIITGGAGDIKSHMTGTGSILHRIASEPFGVHQESLRAIVESPVVPSLTKLKVMNNSGADLETMWSGFSSGEQILSYEARSVILRRDMLSQRFCDDDESLSAEASEYLLQFDCLALTADSDEVRLAKEIFGTEQR